MASTHGNSDFVLDRTLLEKINAERGVTSIQQLSDLAGVHRNSLYPLLRGERSPFTEVFLALCRWASIPPTALVTRANSAEYSVIFDTTSSAARDFASVSPGLAFFLFGSRANRTPRRFSDYDLGVTCGEQVLPGRTFLRIKEFILQRCDDLPVKVDVVNFDDAPRSFLQDFDSVMEYLTGSLESFSFLKGKINGVRANAQT